ncbi:hypothetical protein [Streptomyces sp. C]|uniref:hypothetical protein n=1 Tax=Streptomyces sp. C TaxID=253839 RepID=UPI0019D6E5F9|nr:hypothetical protein [Streptomyces sp. C]
MDLGGHPEDRHEHPEGGQPQPGADGPVQCGTAAALEEYDDRQYQLRDDDHHHAEGEYGDQGAGDRVALVGVEVAEGAARRLDGDGADLRRGGHGEGGAEPPAGPPAPAELRQQPRQRAGVEGEGEAELERLDPHRLVQQRPAVGREPHAGEDDQTEHERGTDHQGAVPCAQWSEEGRHHGLLVFADD